MKPFVLAIKFTTSPEHKDMFKEVLTDLFNTISVEPTFVNAVLHEGTENAHEILVYETRNKSVEDFCGYKCSGIIEYRLRRPWSSGELPVRLKSTIPSPVGKPIDRL